MDTQSISSAASATGTQAGVDATQGLSSDDFFKLLIAQLINQDPLEPTSNQDLLNQISSIRDIELSTNLSESLKSLTDQQRFTSAASLIGQFVSGDTRGDGGAVISGIVESIRFDPDGRAILELEDGQTIPLDEVGSVMNGARAAEALVGRFVTGIDRSDPADPAAIEGIVTGLSTSESGRIMLELDTGKQLRLTDVLAAQAADTTGDAG